MRTQWQLSLMPVDSSRTRPGPVLIVADGVGGSGLLNFVRECNMGGDSYYVVVPLRPRLGFVGPMGPELGVCWPEAIRCFEEAEHKAALHAAGVLAHLVWLIWEMGADAAGEAVSGDLFGAILDLYRQTASRSVAVHSMRSGAAHLSARRLVRRLNERVPAILVDDRRPAFLGKCRSLTAASLGRLRG